MLGDPQDRPWSTLKLSRYDVGLDGRETGDFKERRCTSLLNLARCVPAPL